MYIFKLPNYKSYIIEVNNFYSHLLFYLFFNKNLIFLKCMFRIVMLYKTLKNAVENACTALKFYINI